MGTAAQEMTQKAVHQAGESAPASVTVRGQRPARRGADQRLA